MLTHLARLTDDISHSQHERSRKSILHITSVRVPT
ncbi:hypothetical protein JOF34_000432 [Microbacterium amylolyticum]|uniref:Uncharacterized protein n=1 Tax=Microbacterium amylolyticum TaxID=936337 RepID=A0ABS4ZEY7_9MICO|nr:hypothetical protein [Microbacterium amylolyticum]